MVQQVNEVIMEYDQKIEASPDATVLKVLRSERKYPKRVYKQLINLILRKQKYQ